MEKTKEMAMEILATMDGMPPEDIEKIRTIWLKEIKKPEELEKRFPKVAEFVNNVCDTAIERAKRKKTIQLA